MTTQRNFSYFTETGKEPGEGDALQIYSAVPIDDVRRRPPLSIDVSIWYGDDGYGIYEKLGPENGVPVGRLKGLWGGIGFEVPESAQYFPFVAAKDEQGAFEAIELVNNQKNRLRLSFSEAGDEATLVSTPQGHGEPRRTVFKKEVTRKYDGLELS